jgi:hypothetical protein
MSNAQFRPMASHFVSCGAIGRHTPACDHLALLPGLPLCFTSRAKHPWRKAAPRPMNADQGCRSPLARAVRAVRADRVRQLGRLSADVLTRAMRVTDE